MKKKQSDSGQQAQNAAAVPNCNIIKTDPFGSYTGRPADTQELPVQDADDL